MIVLDTNVVSEPLKSRPSRTVIEWLDKQSPETLYLTSVSLAELLFGVELLAMGRRKRLLAAALGDLLRELFGDRILPFDVAAAQRFALLVAGAQAHGSNVSVADGQIAAIAQALGFAVATRDLEPFEAMGVRVMNPWEG